MQISNGEQYERTSNREQNWIYFCWGRKKPSSVAEVAASAEPAQQQHKNYTHVVNIQFSVSEWNMWRERDTQKEREKDKNWINNGKMRERWLYQQAHGVRWFWASVVTLLVLVFFYWRFCFLLSLSFILADQCARSHLPRSKCWNISNPIWIFIY